MIVEAQSLGEKIKFLREQNKITRVKLASLIGVDEKSIIKYESDENTPKIDKLKLIAKSLNTTVENLTNPASQRITIENKSSNVFSTLNRGQLIKAVRKERQWSQRQLANLSGVHYVQICNYEKGITCPSNDTMDKIGKALQITWNLYISEHEVENWQLQMYLDTILNKSNVSNVAKRALLLQMELIIEKSNREQNKISHKK